MSLVRTCQKRQHEVIIYCQACIVPAFLADVTVQINTLKNNSIAIRRFFTPPDRQYPSLAIRGEMEFSYAAR
jgi:hypothetical protein